MGLYRINGFLSYILVIFLNAFTDLGHKIIIQNTVFKTWDGDTQIILTAIVNALILLPFILLFSPSGFIADKYPKNQVMRYAAWLAVVITIFITISYYAGWFWFAFFLTFILAIQSAIYSPAKYGYIKELVGKDNLTKANAQVQAVTTIAILLGIFCYSVGFEWLYMTITAKSETEVQSILKNIAPMGFLLICGSIIEVILAYRLPEKASVQRAMRFSKTAYLRGSYLRKNLDTVFQHQIIWLSIIGLSIFWGISQVVIAAFPAFAKMTLQENNTIIIQGLLALSGIGIMLGSLMAGRISKNYIETGIIPLGALGITLSLLLLPHLDNYYQYACNFIFLGFSGGIFIIPLNALIQFHAKEHERGLVLAGNNFIQNIVMTSFLLLTVLVMLGGMQISHLFYLLMISALGVTVYAMVRLPQSLIKFIITSIFSKRYRLDVLGFEHIPQTGGLLLLGNHISWLDWAVIQMAIPRRIYFVMERSIYERWYLKRFLDLFSVLPISARASKDAFKKMAELLQAGEVVCLFPEGTISRNGQLGKFQRGYERLARQINADKQVQILPFYLYGLWGSFFSRAANQLKVQRKSTVRHQIIVVLGKPLHIMTSAVQLRLHIVALSFQAWRHYSETLSSIPLRWLSSNARSKRFYLMDAVLEKRYSARQFTVATVLFSRYLPVQTTQHIAICLPTSVTAMIANMAVLLQAKTVINIDYTETIDHIQQLLSKTATQTIITSYVFVEKIAVRLDIETLFKDKQIVYWEDFEASIRVYQKLWVGLQLSVLPQIILRWLWLTPVKKEAIAVIVMRNKKEGIQGIALTHTNILANVQQTADMLNIQDQDIMMANLPLFHSFGMTINMFLPLLENIPVVCHSDPDDVVNISKAISRYNVTVLCTIPDSLDAFTQHRKVHPLMLNSIRGVVSGVKQLHAEIREAFERKFHKHIYEGYGHSETSPVISINIPDCLDNIYWQVQKGEKIGSVGMPVPGTQCKIIDPVSKEELTQGKEGIILVSGVQVMKKYWDNPKATDAVLINKEGQCWYNTGDRGYLDDEGFLHLVYP